VLAKELSTAGFDVVVLEQGRWQQPSEFTHDELAVERQFEMMNLADEPIQTFRTTEAETPRRNTGVNLRYRRGVGGTSVHFSANYWRLRPSDFRERSIFGSIAGTGFADWPVSYEELEPYYTKVDWEIVPVHRVSPCPRGYPPPPMPASRQRVARARGKSSDRKSRRWYVARPATPPGMGGGHCYYYGCEFAQSSTLATGILKVVATGRCEI
jgi:choline dehydrogenase-like flavoprotein